MGRSSTFTTGFPVSYRSSIKEPVALELLVPTNAIALVLSLPTDVAMTAKISRVLPSGGLLSLGVPVIVKVTIKAQLRSTRGRRSPARFLRLSSTVYGKSNVTTQVRYTLIGL